MYKIGSAVTLHSILIEQHFYTYFLTMYKYCYENNFRKINSIHFQWIVKKKKQKEEEEEEEAKRV